MSTEVNQVSPVPAVAEHQPQTTATNTVEDLPNKVFVGNLSFQTTDEELRSFFGPAGKVIHSQIITRGPRSLGYGFVAFETLEDAEKAVAEFSKKELNGRVINVELARPKAERAPRGPRRGRARARGRSSPRRVVRQEQSTEDGNANEPGANGASYQEKGGEGEVETTGSPSDAPRRTRVRGRARERRANTGRRFPPRPLPEGPASTDTVFVSNLPYQMGNSEFQDVFQDYQVKSAVVVTRQSSGRSRGFGFVTFANEDEQKRALGQEFTVDNRKLTLKVAINEARRDESEPKEQVETATPESQ
ncbi:hypothetical protein IWQ61_003620 [Dispira simplex]|nr:hypothetical protein IWQ61_003620 [Dispira simplex]